MERKTPLYDCHVALGGKIVPLLDICCQFNIQQGSSLNIWLFVLSAAFLMYRIWARLFMKVRMLWPISIKF